MKQYGQAYGIWKVTTEGDCEGRSTRDLGIFKGFIDEIALHLADRCYYTLDFKPVKLQEEFSPKANEVHISLPFDLSNNYSERFKDRPVTVEKGSFYKSILIRSKNALTQDEKDKIEREKILSKLTTEERKILGF
jgi:hypothetical protein